MNLESKSLSDGHASRAWRWASVPFLTGGFAWFYAGFYFPDPETMQNASAAILILLWSLRLGMPVAALGAAWGFHMIRLRNRGKEAFLALAAMLMTCLLLYPLANFYYQWKMAPRGMEQFHPYLQIAPQPFVFDSAAAKTGPAVVCLGGSTTEFPDRSRRGWPSYAQDTLNRTLGRTDIRLYNQGRRWYTTLHSLINYETNIRPRRPAALVVMHTINDLLHNADFSTFSSGPFRNDYGHFNGPVARLIERKSPEAFAWDKFRKFWYAPRPIKVDPMALPGVAAFRRNLDAIIDLAKLDSTAVFLMTEPNLYQEWASPEIRSRLYMLNHEAVGPRSRWSYETALRGMETYNHIIRQTAVERGVFLIDLEKEIPKTLDYFTDDVHYTDAAFPLVAKAVAEALLESGLFSQGSGILVP